MKKFSTHIPTQDYWGPEEPMTLKEILALGKSKGVLFQVLDTPVPDGLNSYEESYPDNAVIFDVETEDLVAVEQIRGTGT